MHDALTIGIPTFAVLLSWLFNNMRLSDLVRRTEGHDSRFDRLEAKIDALKDDMHREFRELYRILGQHEKAIEVLERTKA